MPSALELFFSHQDKVLVDLGIQNQQMMRILTLADWHIRLALEDDAIPAEARTQIEIALTQISEARRLEGRDISIVQFAWSLFGVARKLIHRMFR